MSLLRAIFRQDWTLSILVALATLVLGELVLRIPIVQSIIPVSDYGTNNSGIGLKTSRLDAFVARYGPVDCLLIGSSIMDSGGNIGALEGAYQKSDSTPVNCYNFGLGAMPPAGIETFSRFLVARYHPRTLIYTVGAFEFTDSFTTNGISPYTASWVKYQGGQISLDGWLFENLYLSRNFSALRYFFDYNYHVSYDYHKNMHLADTGQEIRSEVLNYQPSSSVRFPDFAIDPQAMQGFVGLLDFADSQHIQIIIVEESVFPDYFNHDYLNGGAEAYRERFQIPIQAACNTRKIVCLDGLPLSQQIPRIGWADSVHLNVIGAKVFSTWLGGQIGDAVVHRTIHPLSQ